MLALLGHMGVRVTLDDQNHVTCAASPFRTRKPPMKW